MKSSRSLPAFLLGALSVALVAGVLALTGVFDGSSPRGAAATAATTSTTAAATPAAATGAPASVADIYATASPLVFFIPATGSGAATATGSGFVIDKKGLIVTNQHVVDGSSRVTVRFGEDGDPIPATVKGQDPSSDVALLKVDPAKVKLAGGIKALPLGESNGLRPGEGTIAIGAPFGLAGTVTTGIVSALNREIQSPNGFPISGAIQTDAAINPGNSGGPLLDARGRAIGVNSQIATNGQSNSSAGVGFAISIDSVKDVVPLLERNGKVDRPYLGVSTSDAPGSTDGAIVRTVIPRGPAAEAGLRTGDRIVRVGDKAVADASAVSAAIIDLKPGEQVAIRYVRGGQERTATVKLGTRPTQARQQG
jgi:putative serine protease PepD